MTIIMQTQVSTIPQNVVQAGDEDLQHGHDEPENFDPFADMPALSVPDDFASANAGLLSDTPEAVTGGTTNPATFSATSGVYNGTKRQGTPRFRTGRDVFNAWRLRHHAGIRPKRYDLGSGFDAIRFGPRRLMTLGAPPGAGKTLLIGQWTFDALRADPDLHALVANVEMDPETDLLDREAQHAAPGMTSAMLADCQACALNPDAYAAAEASIDAVIDRVTFLDPPFTSDHLRAAAVATGARLIVADYLQLFQPGAEARDELQRLRNLLTELNIMKRELDAGILCAVAMHRAAAKEGADLHSGAGGWPLEYSVDSAFTLERLGDHYRLKNQKARRGPHEAADLELMVNPGRAMFDVVNAATLTTTPEAEVVVRDDGPYDKPRARRRIIQHLPWNPAEPATIAGDLYDSGCANGIGKIDPSCIGDVLAEAEAAGVVTSTTTTLHGKPCPGYHWTHFDDAEAARDAWAKAPTWAIGDDGRPAFAVVHEHNGPPMWAIELADPADDKFLVELAEVADDNDGKVAA